MPKLDRKKPTLKIVPVEIGKPFQSEGDYQMRELLHTVIEKEVHFFAVLQEPPKQAPPAPKAPAASTGPGQRPVVELPPGQSSTPPNNSGKK